MAGGSSGKLRCQASGGILPVPPDNFLRRTNEEELEPLHPLYRHRAPPDVRDALCRRWKPMTKNRDGILLRPSPGISVR